MSSIIKTNTHAPQSQTWLARAHDASGTMPPPDASDGKTSGGTNTGAIIVCEIRLYREGLRDGLRQRCSVPVVAMASTASDALEGVCALNPELMLLDMALKGAAQLIPAALDLKPGIKIVVLGINEESQAVLNCVELGAAAYVTRDATLDDLVGTLEATVRGEVLCSPRIAASLFRRVAILARELPQKGELRGLTPREDEILGLINQGFSNKEIARRLRLKLATVKNHVHHILEKLGVSRRGAAAALARAPWR